MSVPGLEQDLCCADADRRRQETLTAGTLNGIDDAEVAAPSPGVPDRCTLLVRCLVPLSDVIEARHVQIRSDHLPLGRPVRVVWAYRAGDLASRIGVDPAVSDADLAAFGEPDLDLLVVRVDQAGDGSGYRLSVVDPDQVLGFDPRLSQAPVSFVVDCPSELDCLHPAPCLTATGPEPVIDYLNRDYTGLRRLLLDRLSVVTPDWTDRSPADLGVTLVEIFAYLGDHLAAAQDAVAAEAYLATARQRVSLARHARLLDYRMHQGCAARTWLVLEVEEDVSAGYLHRIACLPPAQTEPMIPAGRTVRSQDGSVVFHTLHPVSPRSSRNAIDLYTWSGQECCLPLGATEATLVGRNAELALAEGDVLVLEEVRGPEQGRTVDVTHRWAVRLVADPDDLHDPLTGTDLVRVRWFEQDALPFPLCAKRFPAGRCRPDHGAALARGNVVLAAHGTEVTGPVIPAQVPVRGSYRPVLHLPGLAFAVEYSARREGAAAASSALRPDPRDAVADLVRLTDGRDDWTVRADLLSSDRFAPDVVVELHDDGRAQLRFGDDVAGRRPTAGRSFTASYRIGGGKAGNVGREVLTELDPPQPGVAVRNPMPAAGGSDPEPAEQVRQFAPQAFRVQRRAVTDDDYAAAAAAERGVQRAVGTRRWTGSWYTEYVTVDRLGGAPVDADFRSRLSVRLDHYRMAGTDVEVTAPLFVPLEIVLTVCVQPGHFRGTVQRALVERFAARNLPGGARGFFHPDDLSFGQPIYLSAVVAAAMTVPGVQWVDASRDTDVRNRFQRWGVPAADELRKGRIPIDRLEVARCDSEAGDPAEGRISFLMTGGL
jgi:hypothetical protein